MQKEFTYRSTFDRPNPIKDVILVIFLGMSSWPRMLLEVFIRKNFGERYFSLALALWVSLMLSIIPYISHLLVIDGTQYYGSAGIAEFIGDNLSWYLFLILFSVFSYFRGEEMKRQPSVFDFGKYSMSMGEHLPVFSQITYRGEKLSLRIIETIIEPLMFFLISIVLIFFKQNLLGWSIFGCSIVYSLSYMAAYNDGDNFVMDMIDEMICNEEIYGSFVEGVDPKNTRGVNFYGRRPADPEVRKKVYDTYLNSNKKEIYDAV